ncbi:helix-turn-helix transcriptional regulator [Roseiarcaceae bacterium H3SJ34-1]|uniref:helix-turn-helix domain-containing protein n=1 Tax=Terripilifer ovatus TaxID=3032367 RepID=UPI003AB98220|nr:helix-turn-helix transcriptional regulator [Roseiarcaceae bacterium H3SJ34-1]
MDIREIFAINLRAARKEAGLSQEELAYRADLDRTYISSLERCVYAASIDVLDGLAKVLGVDPAELLRRPEGKARAASGPKSRKGSKAG